MTERSELLQGARTEPKRGLAGVRTFATERLLLRGFGLADTEPLHDILARGDVLRYFPRSEPPSLGRVRQMIHEQQTHWRERGYGLWAVEALATGELMGRSGLQYLPETDEVEIDFILAQAHWGQGFATEAGRVGLSYGFTEVGLESIVGIVHPGNGASRRVLEKLGLTLAGPAEYFGMPCYRYTIDFDAYQGMIVP
ncbi:MAG: GNAT family N-acetyltransferase [Anaerolineae bacterium]